MVNIESSSVGFLAAEDKNIYQPREKKYSRTLTVLYGNTGKHCNQKININNYKQHIQRAVSQGKETIKTVYVLSHVSVVCLRFWIIMADNAR